MVRYISSMTDTVDTKKLLKLMTGKYSTDYGLRRSMNSKCSALSPWWWPSLHFDVSKVAIFVNLIISQPPLPPIHFSTNRLHLDFAGPFLDTCVSSLLTPIRSIDAVLMHTVKSVYKESFYKE